VIAALMLIALQSASPAAAPQDNSPQPDDIVITATRDSCKVKFADKDMTDAEFDRRAEEWKAGKPVRVISRGDAAFACVRKISSKLFARGVMKILFVDPDGKPALPFDTSKEYPRYDTTTGAPGAASGGGSGGGSGSWLELRAREHRFITRTAAQLILEGKCDEARTFTLKEGDLEAAASVAEICRK
jgi:hypothetical protein